MGKIPQNIPQTANSLYEPLIDWLLDGYHVVDLIWPPEVSFTCFQI